MIAVLTLLVTFFTGFDAQAPLPGPVGPVEKSEVLALDEAMVRLLEERVPAEGSPVRRLQRLLDAIFDEDGLNFQYDERTTGTARETFHSGRGNCVSFSLMFLAMARQVGVNVHFQEIDLVPSWTRRGNTVLFTRHINVAGRFGREVLEVDLIPRVNQVRMRGQQVSDARGVAHYYNNLGSEYFAAGNLKVARQYYEKALEVASDAAFVWGNLGVVQARSQQLEVAEESYLQALALDPSELTSMENLAALYRVTNRQDKADYYLQKVRRFREKNPYHHYTQGQSAFASGDYESAVGHFREAIRRNSEDPAFYLALAQSQARLGNTREVERLFERTRRLVSEETWTTHYEEQLEELRRKASSVADS